MNIKAMAVSSFSTLKHCSVMLLLTSVAIVQTGHAIPLNAQLEAAYAKQERLQSNPLIGTWQLVSGQYLDEKQQWVDYQHLNLRSIKIISDSHFSFTTIKDVQGSKQFWAAGTGTYQFSDKYYIETPELNSFGVAEGAAFKFEYILKQDKLFTKRIENGVLKEQEVWQRI